MSGSEDKELAGGDMGAGSDGIAGGKLVVVGKRTRDGRKGNVGMTGKWDNWWEWEVNAWNGNVISAKTTFLEIYTLPVVGLRQK